MTEALAAAGMADELSPDEQAILTGAPAPENPPEAGTTPAPEKSADPPNKEPEAPNLSDDDSEESVEVENKGRFVRHGAFHAERQRRKALEKELSEVRDKYSRGDERLRLLSEALNKPTQQQQVQQEQKPPPTPEEDIFGYLKWLAESTNKRLDEVSGKVGKTEQVTQEQQNELALRNVYVSDVQRFVGANADFGDAYKFLIQGRDAELTASGVESPQERARIIQDEEKWLVGMAVKANASPAERVYKLAEARGYKKAAPADPALNGQQQQKPNGAAEAIAAIAKAKAATQSLSNVGGSATADALTMEALASMSEEEYAAVRARMSPAKFTQIMAGA